MYKHFLFFCVLLCCLLFPINSKSQSLADEKVFVSAIQKEIQTQYQKFQNREVPICSLAVRMDIATNIRMESYMGSITQNRQMSQGTLVVDMFVGDLQKGNVTKGSSFGETILLPLDYNVQAIAHILRREIEKEYYKAEEEFLDRQFHEKLLNIVPEPQFFNDDEFWGVTIVPSSNEDVSLEKCKVMLNECTDLWNTFGPDVHGGAILDYSSAKQYDFRDNGSAIVDNKHYTILTLFADIKNREDVVIPIEKTLLAEYPADLPEKNTLWQEEIAMLNQLNLLAEAPAAKAMVCPVLFSGQAAANTLYAAHLVNPFSSNELLSVKEDLSHFTVTATSECKDVELLQQLKTAIRNQNREYGYWIQSLRYSESEVLIPQIMYRVYPDNRANELVSGNVSFVLSPTFWSQISACGDKSDYSIVQHNTIHPQPVVCSSPPVLCYQIEFQKLSFPIKHTLLNPVQTENPLLDLSFSSLTAQVAQDEIHQFFEDTNLLDSPHPYDLEFVFADATTCSIQSSLGSTLTIIEEPLRSVNTRLLVGNDLLNNENLYFSQRNNCTFLPLDNNHVNMARSMHYATEEAYRQALLDYSSKLRKLDRLPTEQQRSRSCDRSEAKRISFFQEEATEAINISHLQALANDLSAQFSQEADKLLNSGVSVDVFQSTAYFISAQNIQYAKPFNLVYVQCFAEAITPDGDTLSDRSSWIFRKMEDVPDMQAEISTMIDRLLAFKNAPILSEYYDGPVIISEEATSTWLNYALLESTPSLLAYPDPVDRIGYEDNYWKKMKNKQVTSPVLSVSERYDSEVYDGTLLMGYYTVDAEGVPVGKKMELIKNGDLLEMLSSRSSSEAVNYSNGHRRLALCNGQLIPMIGAGVLEVDSRKKLESRLLEKELLKQARAAGYKYAFQIVKFGENQTSEGKTELYPLYVYRIRTSNGEKTAIRIRKGEMITAALLNRISATSSDQKVFNIMQKTPNVVGVASKMSANGIPVSIIAPVHFLINHYIFLP